VRLRMRVHYRLPSTLLSFSAAALFFLPCSSSCNYLHTKAQIYLLLSGSDVNAFLLERFVGICVGRYWRRYWRDQSISGNFLRLASKLLAPQFCASCGR